MARPDALDQLVAPHGFSLTLKEHRLAFTAGETATQLLAILEAANEAPTGFRVTSRYITAAACRGDSRRWLA